MSPAYPAVWLLFGLVFAFATAHFMAVSWPQSATIAFYVVPMGWVSVLAWRGRRHFLASALPDALFAGFILLVAASLIFQGGLWEAAGKKYAAYLPFMVLTPYLCGRLMQASDRALLLHIALLAGVSMLPLLLLDRFTSLEREGGRWPFFGQDHGALLVGGLLSATLIALSVRTLECRKSGVWNRFPERWTYLGLTLIVTVFLVWVSARGWLLAGLAGVAVVCLSARRCLIATRLGLLAAVFAIGGVTVISLPWVDPISSMMYDTKLFIQPDPVGVSPDPTGVRRAETPPILGETSCQPFKEGINSVAMRWVMYQEALAIFLENPAFGIGATRFGERSCTGPGWYPHSTILQAFAELGLIGGALLTGLLGLAAVTLMRPFLSAQQGANWPVDAFVLALFAAFLLSDQFGGNYYMAVGTSLMLGIAASLRAHARQGIESHG